MYKRHENDFVFFIPENWNVIKLGTLTAKVDIEILNAAKRDDAQSDTVTISIDRTRFVQ